MSVPAPAAVVALLDSDTVGLPMEGARGRVFPHGVLVTVRAPGLSAGVTAVWLEDLAKLLDENRLRWPLRLTSARPSAGEALVRFVDEAPGALAIEPLPLPESVENALLRLGGTAPVHLRVDPAQCLPPGAVPSHEELAALAARHGAGVPRVEFGPLETGHAFRVERLPWTEAAAMGAAEAWRLLQGGSWIENAGAAVLHVRCPDLEEAGVRGFALLSGQRTPWDGRRVEVCGAEPEARGALFDVLPARRVAPLVVRARRSPGVHTPLISSDFRRYALEYRGTELRPFRTPLLVPSAAELGPLRAAVGPRGTHWWAAAAPVRVAGPDGADGVVAPGHLFLPTCTFDCGGVRFTPEGQASGSWLRVGRVDQEAPLLAWELALYDRLELDAGDEARLYFDLRPARQDPRQSAGQRPWAELVVSGGRRAHASRPPRPHVVSPGAPFCFGGFVFRLREVA